MNILGYILLMALLAFTLFNLYATATKKKREKTNAQKYNALFYPIDQSILDLPGHYKGCPTKRLITENEEGIVCVKNDKKKMAVLAWTGDLKEFSYSSFEGAVLVEEGKTKIEVTIDGEKLTINCTSGKFKKKSFISRTVLKMAKDFVEYLNKIKE